MKKTTKTKRGLSKHQRHLEFAGTLLCALAGATAVIVMIAPALQTKAATTPTKLVSPGLK